MIADFKKFLLRGNVLDLAVAVVIGAAFNAVVQSFVNNIILQFIGGVFGKASFREAMVVSGDNGKKVYLSIGSFLTDVVNFLIIAAAIFMVVKAFEKLQERRKVGAEPEAAEPLTVEGELLAEIRDLLRDRPVA